MADLTGRTLGPYRVLEQLGMGGMATVYKAYHAAMDRYVAIKVLPEHLARDAGFRARFEREARTIARLEHRHILPVYDVAEDDGIPYLVMRFTDGGDLSDLIIPSATSSQTSGGLTFARAGELVAQVADALAYAHRLGVIHRDVKPANVLIGRDGDALLSDFGIAKIYSDTQQLTSDGMLVGTPAYMAPEQLQGRAVDARADIYALGVVLYQALTGECPFVAETPLAVALMHIHNPLRPPRQLNPAIPEALERVVLRAMAKNPEDRFQDGAAMAQALRAALSTTGEALAPSLPAFAAPPAERPPSALAEAPMGDPLPATRPARRRLLLPAAVIGVAVLIMAAALAWSLARSPAGGQTAAGTPGGAPTVAPAADVRQALDAALRQLDANDAVHALDTLKPALESNPDDANLLAARGVANAMYSGADVARPDIDRALSLAPDNALVYYARGYLNSRTDKPDDAIADYTRAIELDPAFARAYYQRSVLLGYPKNDTAGRQRDLDRTIELDPDYVAARMDRAWTLYYSDAFDRALADADHVVGLNPKQSAALHLRALVYARQGRTADARRDFDAAAAAAPEDRSILGDRSIFLVRQGDFEAALADADRLVALDGANPDFYHMRGAVLYMLKRYDDALSAFDQAILIVGSEDWAGRYGRGLALLALGRAPDALADLEAAQAHSSDIASVAELFFGNADQPSIDLARAYRATGETDRALKTLDAAVEQGTEFGVYFERGQLRAELGDSAGARADFQEALRRASDAKNDQQRALVEAELAKLR